MIRTKNSHGAVFIEALIVISVFIIFLLGILYFRELYLAKFRSQRLARAGALAHAMGACKTDVNAAIKSELPKSHRPQQGTSGQDALVPKMPADQGESRATRTFEGISQNRGGTVLNRVDMVNISASASATTRPDPLGPEKGFRGTVGSRSYVSCADEVTSDQYSAVASRIPALLGF